MTAQYIQPEGNAGAEMSYLYAGVYIDAGIVVMPPKLTWLPVAWGLVEIPLATLLGAWVYRE
jgi:hypothetical protein